MSSLKNIRFPIVSKLVVITAGLLLCAAIPIAHESSSLFEKYLGEREADNNRAQARSRANEVDNLFRGYMEKAKVVASLLTKEYQSSSDRDKTLWLSFQQDQDLVAIEILERKGQSHQRIQQEINSDYLQSYNLETSYIDVLRQQQKINLQAVFEGDIEIRNASLKGGAPLLTMVFPLSIDELQNVTHIVRADLRLDRLQSAFAYTTEREAYLVDDLGGVIAHSDENIALSATDWSMQPMVSFALKQQIRQGDKEFANPLDANNEYLGSFSRTSFGPIVISQAPKEVILAPARIVQREAFYYSGLVFFGALFFIFVFSMTLTNPIETLLSLANRIAQGDFDVNAKAKIRSRDEVGDLASAFDGMTSGLKERDKVKNIFSKFHGSGLADDLLKKDLTLGGERKEVTVFFSDIRDFTAFSEGQSPEKVVEMLNEYFDVMVSIITKHGGVVDKFIGDAIMAVWGSLDSSTDHTDRALKACLQMRRELEALNQKRNNKNQIPIKIGMALHRGDVISGTIGSNERMEYTVIGDTVNTAARLEASTKSFGTDLLVSQQILDSLKGQFISELAGKAEVKGKEQALCMYKVRGYTDENGQTHIIKTIYSDFEASSDAKVKVA